MSERQASTYRRGEFTNPHLKVLKILSENGVNRRPRAWRILTARSREA